MVDHILVLNAGSSSLKFCVFRRSQGQPWQSGARGQIEGIGTSPKLSVKGASGEKLADETLSAAVCDGATATDALAAWLRSKFTDAHLVGVGHRVVHGGSRFGSPVQVNREILAELGELTPLAPLHQPHNIAP